VYQYESYLTRMGINLALPVAVVVTGGLLCGLWEQSSCQSAWHSACLYGSPDEPPTQRAPATPAGIMALPLTTSTVSTVTLPGYSGFKAL
jgi:hypothetical protein